MKNKTITIQVEQGLASKTLKTTESRAELTKPMVDPSAKRLFWYLFAGTVGGETRARIIMLIKERPYNTNQLAEKLGLDYKAIQHHIRVLEKNNLITRQGARYGVMFFISPYLDAKFDAFDEIYNEIGKNK